MYGDYIIVIFSHKIEQLCILKWGAPPPIPPGYGSITDFVRVRVQSCSNIPINTKLSGDKSGAHKHLGTDKAINAIF